MKVVRFTAEQHKQRPVFVLFYLRYQLSKVSDIKIAYFCYRLEIYITKEYLQFPVRLTKYLGHSKLKASDFKMSSIFE